MKNPKSIYIHIPFCSHKCLFCSFAIAVGAQAHIDKYLDCLENEIKQHNRILIDTLYLGGGTPSVLNENQLVRLMAMIKDHFILNDRYEFTLEANPENLDKSKIKFLKNEGVNRLSIGIQSLNESYLKYLGRKHDVTLALKVIEDVKQEGFSNINLDLMYAFPNQTIDDLTDDVHAIAKLNSQHLSLYTLTIEPKSRFYIQEVKLDDEEKIANQYLMIVSLLKNYGFNQYEISNFAKEGFESKHNRQYWLGEPYLGIGMGAHGFTGTRRYWNHDKLSDYLAASDPQSGFEDLNAQTLQMERVLFGLRMNEGIDSALVPIEKQKLIDDYIIEGFFQKENGRLKATIKGQLVLDELSARLI